MLLLFLFSIRVIIKEMVIIISIKRSKISAKDDDDDDDDVFYVQVSNYSMTRYKLQRPISYRPHCISAWDGWSEAL